MNLWVSPRLGITFELTATGLEIKKPNGEKFLSFLEINQKAETAQQQADAATERIKFLEAKLRELGFNEDF